MAINDCIDRLVADVEAVLGSGRVHNGEMDRIDSASALAQARDKGSTPAHQINFAEVTTGAVRTADDGCDGLQLSYTTVLVRAWLQLNDAQRGSVSATERKARANRESLVAWLQDDFTLGGTCLELSAPSSTPISHVFFQGVACCYFEIRAEVIERRIVNQIAP